MERVEILVVDDEAAIRLAIRRAFRKENMEVMEACDGKEALELLERRSFDLIILDVMMEEIGGLQVLQELRAKQDMTPVMVLSGKSDEMDQVLGLGFGADSYLTKPFHITVLIQSAKALLRRNRIYNQGAELLLHCGPFRLDLRKMECRKDGTEIPFTARELTLFRFLMENPGRVFSKEQLYHQVWSEYIVDDNTITVYIRRIRGKIEEDPKSPRYLKTIRGIGYRLDI